MSWLQHMRLLFFALLFARGLAIGDANSACGTTDTLQQSRSSELSLLQTATLRNQVTVDTEPLVFQAPFSHLAVHAGILFDGPTILFLCVSLALAVLLIILFLLLIQCRLRGLRHSVECQKSSSIDGLFGVPLSFGSFKLSAWTGQLQISDIAISNPAGYKSDSVLHIEHAVATIDLLKLACYGRQHVAIDRLDMSGLIVTYERKSSSGSNVQDVLKSAGGITKAAEAQRGKLERHGSNPLNWAAGPGRKSREALEKIAAERSALQHVLLQEVLLQDIRILVAEESSNDGHEAALSVSVSSIEHKSFIDEVQETRWEEIARILLSSLLKAVHEKARGSLSSGHVCCSGGLLKAASALR